MKVSCQNRTNKTGSGRESHQSTNSLWLDPCSHPSGNSASFPINLCLVFNFLLFNFFQLSLLCLFDPQMPSYFFSKARPLSLLSLFNANLTSRFPSWHSPTPTPHLSVAPCPVIIYLFVTEHWLRVIFTTHTFSSCRICSLYEHIHHWSIVLFPGGCGLNKKSNFVHTLWNICNIYLLA